MSQRRYGFTLIELLVVIAIIALLLSILTPALNTVKERAKRILCKNRLRQWAIAIVAYNSANDNLMFIPRRHGEGPFPHYMGMVKDGYYTPAQLEAVTGPKPGEWDVFRINPYIEAFSKTYYPGDPADPLTDCTMTDLVACPNCSGDFMKTWCTWNCEWDWDFNEPGYSYWVLGGMPNPPDTGNPDDGSDGEASDYIYRDLTVDTLSPKRLLMTEILSKDGWGGGAGDPYRYNHGKTGWSWFTPDVIGHTVYDPDPKATGRSQAFGDGHIEWRDIPLKECENLPTSQCPGGIHEDRWNGPGSGWIQRWNVSWY